jgi:hypothetical protein
MNKPKFRKICHTKCYKYETLWDVGDVYEGDEDPGKHFSDDGINTKPEPPKLACDDPRSTVLMVKILKETFGVTMPKSRGRKKIWAKLHEMEKAAAQDEQTQDAAPEPPVRRTAARKPSVKRSK